MTREELLRRWNESGQTDFSVYRDPGYIDECWSSWEKSQVGTRRIWQYFKHALPSSYGLIRPYTGPDHRTLTVLDVYSGNGMPAITLKEHGFNVQTFNDCDDQIAFMNNETDKRGLDRIQNHTVLPDDRYDIIISFECLEHFKEPLVHVQDLLRRVKPGGFICESTGFGKDCIGHFNEYIVRGERMSARRTSLQVGKMFKEHAEKVFVGFSKMPRIWQVNT